MSFLTNLLDAGATALSFANPTSAAFRIGSQALGTMLQGASADQQLQQQLNMQRKLQQEQNDFELHMWNLNNDYNSLASQIQRAKEAGVSPNAIINNNPSSVSNPVQSNPLPQIDTLSHDTYNRNNAANRLALENSENQSVQTKWDKATFEERVKVLHAQWDDLVAGKGLKEAQIAFANADTAAKNEFVNWYSKLSQAQLDNMVAQLKVLQEQKELISSQADSAESQSQLDALKAKFANDTGITPDMSMFHICFKLFQENKFAELCEVLGMNAALSVSNNASNVISDLAGGFVGKLIKGVGDGLSQIFNPTKGVDGKGVLKGNTITWE